MGHSRRSQYWRDCLRGAFLTPDILDKHRIPFYTDIEVGLMTLNKLKVQIGAFKHIVVGLREGTSIYRGQSTYLAFEWY